MVPTSRGAIRLFRFAGINVYLHWSWLVVAFFQIAYRMQLPRAYSSPVWCIYEYLALFVIVTMHEFGHSLACRSVGGKADQIVLWPLGGVAYVDPPPRPGATLWSIAAGPLVNVVLIPITFGIYILTTSLHWSETHSDVYNLIWSICFMNGILLAFNILPVYPLDGGKILWALLWFLLGRARSLMVASSIGLVAVVLLFVFAIRTAWLAIMGVFVLMNCWSGLQQARILGRMDSAPRRTGLACPHCKKPPPAGNFWGCGRCRTGFDIFATRGVCPNCGTIFNVTRCLECGEMSPIYAYAENVANP